MPPFWSQNQLIPCLLTIARLSGGDLFITNLAQRDKRLAATSGLGWCRSRQRNDVAAGACCKRTCRRWRRRRVPRYSRTTLLSVGSTWPSWILRSVAWLGPMLIAGSLRFGSVRFVRLSVPVPPVPVLVQVPPVPVPTGPVPSQFRLG